MGGWISIDGKITEYFACPLSQLDVLRYGHPIGSANGQQIWECLAILVAVDIWHAIWSQSRVVLKVKGDNVTALTMLVKMRPDGPKMAMIARELALRLAKLSFPPDATHTPGVAHKIADLLSRVYMPGESKVVDDTLHPMLVGAVRVDVPIRDDSYYRAVLHEPTFYRAEGDDWGSRWP